MTARDQGGLAYPDTMLDLMWSMNKQSGALLRSIHNFGLTCAENFSSRLTTNPRAARISRHKSEEIPSLSRFI
jgi:hypothetical protein